MRPSRPIMPAGKIFSASAPAASAAKHSRRGEDAGVGAEAELPWCAAMTAAVAVRRDDEAWRRCRPPRRTSSGVSTVPAPMWARPPSAACIAAMLSSGLGRVQRHLDPVDAGIDQRVGGLDGARRDRGRAGWRSGGGSCLGPLGRGVARGRRSSPARVIAVASSVARLEAAERQRRAVGGGQRRARRSARRRGRASRAGRRRARRRSGGPRAGRGRAPGRGRRAGPRRGCRRGGPASALGAGERRPRPPRAKSGSDQPSAPTEWRSTEDCRQQREDLAGHEARRS